MSFSLKWLFIALFTRRIAGKQPDFFVESDARPPAPPTMNVDFFEDPPGVPLAQAPADGPSELLTHLEALPPAPAPETQDAPMLEAMPPASAPGDFDSPVEQAQESQSPTWGDFAAQQSTNAQLAERVAKLTKATHLLWHEERTLRRKSHQKILNMKKKCHISHQPVHFRPDLDEEQSVQRNLRQKPVVPVSLTHAATKHKRKGRVDNEGSAIEAASGTAMDAAEDSGEGPLVGTVSGSMAGMYAAEGPEVEKTGAGEAAKKRQLEDELTASRARLGRNEEGRLHLEDQIRDLEEKFQQGLREAEQRKQDLVAAQKRQRAKELELKSVKTNAESQDTMVAAALRNEFGASMKMAQDRIEQEKQDLLIYRDKADVKLRARKNEARNLQAKNTELRKQLQGQMDAEKAIQDQLKAAQDTWSRLSGQVEALHRDEVEVSEEQQTEEQRLVQENDKLHGEAEEERQCMDWGHRLEARLQHELKRKVTDAKLCRDSILSLHNERLELKSKSVKYKRELEEEALREGEARRSYDENQKLLDHCLGQMAR